MLYFILRLLVNAIAVAFTLLLIPGIRVEPVAERQLSLVVILLLLGLLFGLINAFIRPLVLLVTGQLVVISMGVFTLIINGLLFYLLSYLIPNILVIESPVFMWVTLAGAVMAVVVTILEALFGLDSPVIDPEKKSKFYWRWFGRLPAGRRNRIVENIRLMQVKDTIRRFGIDVLIDLTPLARFRQFWQRLIYPDKHAVIEESAPVTVRLMLQELGPTYVKLGQMFASRSEILPPEWQAEFSQLQSDVDPFPYAAAREIIYRELGDPPEVLFEKFEPVPLAAASTAQIHQAALPSGEQIVVKVQRPDIDVTVRGDLNVMSDVVATLEKRVNLARNLGLSGILAEFSENVIEELDYQNEAYNIRRLKQTMSKFENVLIPQVYGEFSTSRVLTMDFVQGVKLTQTAEIDAAGIDRRELARQFIRIMCQQVLLDGFFHGDPHPGNVLVNLDDSRLIFLDMGMMGLLDDEQRLAMLDVIWSLHTADSRNLTRILLQLSTKSREIDEASLVKDIDHMIQRYLVYAEQDPPFARIAQELLSLMSKYGLRLNRSMTIALKSLMQAEELVRTLAPEISFLETSVDEVQGVLLDQVDGEIIYEKLKDNALRTAKDALVRWPTWKRSAQKWINQIEAGQFTINLDTREFNHKVSEVDQSLKQSIRQVLLVLLLVGMLLGSAIISTISLENLTFLEFLPQDIFVGVFLLVASISLFYILSILWTAWRNR